MIGVLKRHDIADIFVLFWQPGWVFGRWQAVRRRYHIHAWTKASALLPGRFHTNWDHHQDSIHLITFGDDDDIAGISRLAGVKRWHYSLPDAEGDKDFKVERVPIFRYVVASDRRIENSRRRSHYSFHLEYIEALNHIERCSVVTPCEMIDEKRFIPPRSRWRCFCFNQKHLPLLKTPARQKVPMPCSNAKPLAMACRPLLPESAK